MDDGRILAVYSEAEPAAEAGAFIPYRVVLERVMEAIANAAGFEPSTGERSALVRSFPTWRPFPDTVDALRTLATKYQLGIISNVDDALFAETHKHFTAVDFTRVITAEQARSYKPSRHNFDLALERIALPREAILHCAESIFHDVVPAKALGLATVHVDRAHVAGEGATRHVEETADLVVADLRTLAQLAIR